MKHALLRYVGWACATGECAFKGAVMLIKVCLNKSYMLIYDPNVLYSNL